MRCPNLPVCASKRPTAVDMLVFMTSGDGSEPARVAAFFDLDKTIIAKSSTLVLGKPFFPIFPPPCRGG
jgi:hypothetical protein